MDVFTGVITFFLIWWVVLFAVLPWGNRTPDEPVSGFAGSAPENPRIWAKFAVTTGISVLLWLIMFALIQIEIIDFHDYAKSMGQEK